MFQTVQLTALIEEERFEEFLKPCETTLMTERHDINRETEEEIYFFTPPFYAFDNFSAYSIEIWDRKFQTSEHAYQWRKYIDSRPDLAEDIFNATSPHAVKKISDAHKSEISLTEKEKLEYMESILRAKLAQHEKVRRTLIESGHRTIIENSPEDNFWGIGSGDGKNMLGKLWMKIRDELTNL